MSDVFCHAPPNSGSELADELAQYPAFEAVLGPLAYQLGTGRESLPRTLPPPPIPFGVIAGDRWWNPVGPMFLAGAHDGVVTVDSTRLVGMSDHIIVPYTHTFLMNSSTVAEAIAVFLESGSFPGCAGEGGDCRRSRAGFDAATSRGGRADD